MTASKKGSAMTTRQNFVSRLVRDTARDRDLTESRLRPHKDGFWVWSAAEGRMRSREYPLHVILKFWDPSLGIIVTGVTGR